MTRRTTCRLACMVWAAGLVGSAPVHAVDLGAIGPSYGIAEPHLLQDIEGRLRDKQRSGELQRLMDAARQRGVDAVRHPAPVEGLRTASVQRSYHVDPSFTLDRNISDAQGRLLFVAGTRKNPLEVVSLSRRLLFFDARDARQVRQAQQVIALYDGRIKLILTAGSYLHLMKRWRVPVFYDQHGGLTRRLGIQQVPALVSQEGMRLRVDELRVLP